MTTPTQQGPAVGDRFIYVSENPYTEGDVRHVHVYRCLAQVTRLTDIGFEWEVTALLDEDDPPRYFGVRGIPHAGSSILAAWARYEKVAP